MPDDRGQGGTQVRPINGEEAIGVPSAPSPDAVQLAPDAPLAANELFKALALPITEKSLDCAAAILKACADPAEVLAIPEVQARYLLALSASLKLCATSEEGMDRLEAFAKAGQRRIVSLGGEFDAARKDAYLEAVKTGHLELVLRVEQTILGDLQADPTALQAAVRICCLNALRMDEMQSEGSPVGTFLRLFSFSHGFDAETIRHDASILHEVEEQHRAAIVGGFPNKLRKLSEASNSEDPPEKASQFQNERIKGLETALTRGDARNVEFILDWWNLPPDIIDRTPTLEAALAGLERRETPSRFQPATKLLALFPRLVTNTDPAFEEKATPVIAEALARTLAASPGRETLEAVIRLGLPDRILGQTDLAHAVHNYVLRPLLLAGELDESRQICKDFRIPETQLKDLLTPDEKLSALVASLKSKPLSEFQDLVKIFEIDQKQIQEPHLLEVAKVRLTKQFAQNAALAYRWLEIFPVLRSALTEIGLASYSEALLAGNFTAAEDVRQRLFGSDFSAKDARMPELPRALAHTHDLETLQNLAGFVLSNQTYVSYLGTSKTLPLLKKDEFARVGRLGVAPEHVEPYLAAGNSLGDLNNDETARRLVDYLIRHDSRWSSAMLRSAFEHGAGYFGAAAMLRFASHPDYAPDYCLQNIPQIVRFAQDSGVPASRFAEQILTRVRRDGGEYSEGSSYELLRSIATALTGKFELVIQSLSGVSEHSPLAAMRGRFETKADCVASWDSLKQLVAIIPILEQPILLAKLAQYKTNGRELEANYLQAIALRADSRVNPQDAFRFIESPETFFAQDDYGTTGPSQLMKIPYLPISGDSLRDAIVRGGLDRIMAFPPCSAECEVLVRGDKVYLGIRELLSDALGSQRNRIPGLAKNSKQLFAATQALLKDSGVTVPEYLSGKKVSSELDMKIRALAIDGTFGMKVEKLKLVAAVHRKSAPEAATAGNETQCCMPFGASNQNDYMLQPNVAHFTVQTHGDNRRRTLAQSVLTKDCDVKARTSSRSVPDYYRDIPEGERLERTISADNVEVNRNARDPRSVATLVGVYTAFFQAYNERFSAVTKVNTEFVAVGKQYSDALTALQDVPNTFQPQNRLLYSDKIGGTVGKLDLKVDTSAILITLQPHDLPEPRSVIELPRAGLRSLTYHDLPEVVRVESINSESGRAEHEIAAKFQILLHGKDLLNAVENRANLSLGFGSKHALTGYLLAFEGEVPAVKEPVIVINNVATLRGASFAFGSIVHGFGALYQAEYVSSGKLYPVMMEVRGESERARFIKTAERLAQRLNLSCEVVDLDAAEEQSVRHRILVRLASRRVLK